MLMKAIRIRIHLLRAIVIVMHKSIEDVFVDCYEKKVMVLDLKLSAFIITITFPEVNDRS
jgi:hypothetical protein